MQILAWLLAGSVALWAVFRVGGLDRAHPLVALVSFTPHVTAASAGVVLLLAALRQWRPLALGLTGTLALAACVLPRASGGGPLDGPLRVLTVNVSFGEVPAEAVTEIVRERDIHLLSVQELTPDFDARLRAAGIEDLLPNDVVEPVEGVTGSGLFAKLPLSEIPGPDGGPFVQVAARTRFQDLDLEVVSVHAPPPVSEQHVQAWHDTLRELPPGDRPRILAGDFNATLDHRALRRVIDSGYTDAADATGNGLTATWPANRGRRPGIAIDHVLYTREFRAAYTHVLALPAGDHRAVEVGLVARASTR